MGNLIIMAHATLIDAGRPPLDFITRRRLKTQANICIGKTSNNIYTEFIFYYYVFFRFVSLHPLQLYFLLSAFVVVVCRDCQTSALIHQKWP